MKSEEALGYLLQALLFEYLRRERSELLLVGLELQPLRAAL